MSPGWMRCSLLMSFRGCRAPGKEVSTFQSKTSHGKTGLIESILLGDRNGGKHGRHHSQSGVKTHWWTQGQNYRPFGDDGDHLLPPIYGLIRDGLWWGYHGHKACKIRRPTDNTMSHLIQHVAHLDVNHFSSHLCRWVKRELVARSLIILRKEVPANIRWILWSKLLQWHSGCTSHSIPIR